MAKHRLIRAAREIVLATLCELSLFVLATLCELFAAFLVLSLMASVFVNADHCRFK